MTAQANEVINVQPHPRLLGVLGDIEFQPWQCLAELADNAFDEFLRHPGQGGDPLRRDHAARPDELRPRG